ncbi:MAG: RidA family protein, partial [Thiolinea sp.]
MMPVHKRIRPFNTKDTYPEQNLDNDLCQVVVAKGTMVFVRGQIGTNLDTSENVGVGDVTAQTNQAMKNVAMLLDEAGSELAHICKL